MTQPADSSDDALVMALWERIDHAPENDAQRALCLVWDATLLVNSGGVEKLFEQAPTLEEYAAAFVAMDMPEAARILERTGVLVPADLRAGEGSGLGSFVKSHFDELWELSRELYEVTTDVASFVMRYVRSHPADFGELPEEAPAR